MPILRCPHCGSRTFSIEGWTDLDHCASCGRRLADASPDNLATRVRDTLHDRKAKAAGDERK